jgi:hypothetical protein
MYVVTSCHLTSKDQKGISRVAWKNMRVAERTKIKDQEKKKKAALLHLIIVLDMNNIKYCPVLLHICQCLTDRHSCQPTNRTHFSHIIIPLIATQSNSLILWS